MSIAYYLTPAVTGVMRIIVSYPVRIWILGAATSKTSIMLIVASRLAMLLACGYVIVAVLALSKKRGQGIAVPSPLKMPNNGAYTAGETEKTNDSMRGFFSEEKVTHFNSAIDEFLNNNKPFLRRKYSLRNLSDDVDIPVHYLSAFINHYYKMNYNNYINKYRVSQSKEMILNGEWKHKKLEAIASESGFNNRNTFTVAFRKETGQSPSEYVEKIKRGSLCNKEQKDQHEQYLGEPKKYHK